MDDRFEEKEKKYYDLKNAEKDNAGEGQDKVQFLSMIVSPGGPVNPKSLKTLRQP